MTGLRELFLDWRKERAEEEENFIKSAMMFAAYVQTIDNIQQVTLDFSTVDSAVYQSFDVYGGRSVGVLLYSKLMLGQLLESNRTMSSTERLLLTKISNTLTASYENPTTNTKQNLENLIFTTKQLLSLELDSLSDVQQAKTLCYVLYIFLSTVILSVSKLNKASIFLINRFVDLDGILKKLQGLWEEARERVGQIDAFLLQKQANADNETQDFDKSIQEYFNLRYLLLINKKQDQNNQLSLLDTGMGDVIDGLSRLIYVRKELNRLKELIPSLQELLRALEANESKVTGRQYIWEIIAHNREAYELLMANCSGRMKSRLERNLKQLQSPDLIQYMVLIIGASLSWLTSPISAVYRYVTPKYVQDRIPEFIQTLDSDCKHLLKTLLEQSSLEFTTRLTSLRMELLDLPTQIARDNPRLARLIQQDSSEHLSQLHLVNTEIRSTLSRYIHLAAKIDQYHEVVKQYQQTDVILTDFITKNDGFWVQVSNFFARFCSLFKSKTAQMIDDAKELQRQIGQYELEYKLEVEKTVVQVESMLTLELDLKKQLISLLRHPETNSSTQDKTPNLEHDQVLELMKETSVKLYAKNPNRMFYRSRGLERASEESPRMLQPFG